MNTKNNSVLTFFCYSCSAENPCIYTYINNQPYLDKEDVDELCRQVVNCPLSKDFCTHAPAWEFVSEEKFSKFISDRHKED